MSTESGFRIIALALAIALFGALTWRPGLAEEANSAAGAAAPAVENAGPAPGAKDRDAIDTRIAVVPHRPDAKRTGLGTASAVRSVSPRNLLSRRVLPPGTSEPGARNALGIPVVGVEGSGQHSGTHGFAVVHSPALGPIGIVGGTSDAPSKPPIFSVRPLHLQPSVIASPTTLSRGSINGTGFTHRGVGPSGIGGPAKTVAGINGSAIRPAH